MEKRKQRIKKAFKELDKNKITLRLERDGKYIEKKITPRMVCALFDLQYMMDNAWETIKLNKMTREMKQFFRIIEYFDDAMHGDKIGHFDKKSNKIIWRKKKDEDYLFGKPDWKPVKK